MKLKGKFLFAIFFFVISFFLGSSAFPQFQISKNDRLNLTSDKISGDNISESVKSEDVFGSVNIKFNSVFNTRPSIGSFETYGGLIGEFEFKTSKKIGLILSINAVVDFNEYTKYYGTWIDFGPRFYFTDSRLNGFAGVIAGIFIKQGGFLNFAPSIGLEYKINKYIKFQLEGRSNFVAHYYGDVLFPSINAGIGFLLY